jgi:hypothetical protein
MMTRNTSPPSPLTPKTHLPKWIAPDWLFGDATCDPEIAPLTLPARYAVSGGIVIGIALGLAICLRGLHFSFHDNVEIAIMAAVAALSGWWGFSGANAAARWVMVRRATPMEVFIAGAAGAMVCVLFNAASSGSSSSSSSSSDSSDGGSFGGGGASGKW